jgi:hypothetical protein
VGLAHISRSVCAQRSPIHVATSRSDTSPITRRLRRHGGGNEQRPSIMSIIDVQVLKGRFRERYAQYGFVERATLA